MIKFRLMRLRLTFALLFEFKGKKYMPIIQFSTKDMWFIPKVDRNFCKGKDVLYGWLFFYIGYCKDPSIYTFK